MKKRNEVYEERESVESYVSDTIDYIKAELSVLEKCGYNPAAIHFSRQLEERIKIYVDGADKQQPDSEFQERYHRRLSEELRALNFLNAIFRKPGASNLVRNSLLSLASKLE